MKILAVHNYYEADGGESTVFDTEVSMLREAGHHVTTYTRANRDISGMGLTGRLSLAPNCLYSLRTCGEVSRILEEERFDVALVQNVFPLISPSVYGALCRHGVPVVQLMHNHRMTCVNGQLFRKGRVCKLCMDGRFLRSVPMRCYRNSAAQTAVLAASIRMHDLLGTFRNRISAFVMASSFMVEYMTARGFDPERLFINSNPFRLPPAQPEAPCGDYAVFIGRLIPDKGIRTLIECAKFLPRGINVTIVGEGDLRAETEAAAANPGSPLRFLGPVYGDAMHDLVRKARFVLIPSEFHDTGVHMMYVAYGWGRPVIASRIAGISEMVDEGVTGLLFEPGDAPGLGRRIEQLWSSPDSCRRMGLAARQYAERHFGVAGHMKRLEEIIGCAIARPATGKQQETRGLKEDGCSECRVGRRQG